MKKELIDQKFKKLSDVNKIRYNIGRIFFNQKKILVIILVSFMIIIGNLFFLPFFIRYGGFNGIFAFAFVGVITIMFGWILLIVEIFKFSKKDNEVLEKFLNDKSKERKR